MITMDFAIDPRRDFDGLFESNDGPWQMKQRWYEARKRALTLACLPRARCESGYEPGCADGELSAGLAERCDRLLISDGAAAAVALAQRRASPICCMSPPCRPGCPTSGPPHAQI